MLLPQYIDAAAYEKLVEAVVHQTHNPECPASAVKLAIGELLNVWPVTVKDDPHWCAE